MHVLVIEAALTGHHAGYLERIAGAYMESGHTVTLTILRRDEDHHVIKRLKSRFKDTFMLFLLADEKFDAALHSRLSESGRELALRQMFGYAYRTVNRAKRVDYVFLPYLDYCLYALGLLGSPFGITQWGGICMRPSFHYRHFGVFAPKPKLSNFKLALFLKLLRNKTLRSIYTIDELLYRYVAERYSQWSSRLHYVPDPAELSGCHTYKSARQELSIPDGSVVVLVYGAIDERKGLDVLIDAICTNQIPKTLHLLVAGRQSRAIQMLMASKKVIALIQQGRCHIINTFVDTAVEQQVFAASDIVWIGYRNHYSMSGVLVLAALSGKTILGTSNGLIGWHVREQDLGHVANVEDLASVIHALQRCLSDKKTQMNKVSQRQTFLSDHSWNSFLKKIIVKKL